MNMLVLQPSRKRRMPGDVFVYQMPDGLFRFGRLISVTVPVFEGLGAHMVYLFGGASESKDPPAALDPHALLMAPVLLNRLPWTLGYFEVVRREPLQDGDTLPRHCFQNVAAARERDRFLDEHGSRLRKRLEPCGYWGLGNHVTLDIELSRTLGLPVEGAESAV